MQDTASAHATIVGAGRQRNRLRRSAPMDSMSPPSLFYVSRFGEFVFAALSDAVC
jgi:hypothetical protein